MGQSIKRNFGGRSMKKIAIITGGILPMPSVKGGAIETLLQYYIDYNEEKQDFELDIYSIFDDKALKESKNYHFCKFHYIQVPETLNKVYFNFFRVIHKLGYQDPNFRHFYIQKVCQLLKNKSYDLILIESDNHFVLPIKKVNKAKIALYLHNDKLNSNVRNHQEIADACTSIQTVSDYIKGQVLTIDNRLNKKANCLLNGIDTVKFQIKNKEQIRKDFRNQYHISNHDFVYLFTGRIEFEKGVLELVKAFQMMNRKNTKLMILGGSFYSSSKKTRYVKMVEREIQNNSNIIVTGYVNNQEIPKYHAMADCMVVSSQWEEPAGLVSLESFASGLPLISSDCGGTPQYTKDTKSILIKRGPNFIKDLSMAMEKVMDDKEFRLAMIESGLNKSTYFSKERYCNDLNHYLNTLVK